MGRQKKAPVRCELQDKALPTSDDLAGNSNSEVLGRFSSHLEHQPPSLDMMLEAEIAEDSEHKLVINPPKESEDDSKQQSSHHPLVESDDGSSGDEVAAVSFNRHRMPPMLAEIERKIAAQERETRARRIQNKKRKKVNPRKRKMSSNKGLVQLPSEELLEDIPPELVIEHQETTKTTLLHVTPLQISIDVAVGKSNPGIPLASFDLVNAIIPNPQVTTGYRLQAGNSIRVLWNHFSLTCESICEGYDFLHDLIKCSDSGWIYADLSSGSVAASPILTLTLAEQAFLECRNLPLIQHKSQRTKFGVHNALQRVIRSLFHIPKAAPIFSSDLRSKEEITAKYVYDLLDNKQLERFASGQQPFPAVDIPGLVPTLRPYQAAAVQWMLQRESMSHHGEEWKVAWMILNTDTRETMPLTRIDNIQYQDSPCYLFYSPFNGWIARSSEAARNMTLKGRTNPVRGGCLAESMGLGKTVELLACILAHPMPGCDLAVSAGPTCQRRLDFDDKHCAGQIAGDAAVCIFGDNVDFADDDASNSDSGIEEIRQEASEADLPKDVSTPSPNMVTPVKSRVQVEERWIDDVEIGSCICGEIVSFPSGRRKQKSMMVLCKGCDEPMHLECACFETNELPGLQRLDLRRTFGNETLECILCEECPCCVVRGENILIQSRATVVVCPPSIVDQWDREVRKHTRGKNGLPLKVTIYEGVESISKNPKKQPGALRLLHPTNLADTDIILIPFAALMSDLGHSDENRFVAQTHEEDRRNSCNLRKRKKYRIVPSPLLSIHFWRVAIDEAQRLEVTTTKAAKMALKLKASHFWAVSGTPIGHGKLEDLYGLLLFLGLSPFDDKTWFRSCLSMSVNGINERIVALLKDCFWRSTKASDIVNKQLGIPEMRENRVILKFSSIERHFYSTQLDYTLGLAGNLTSQATMGSKRQFEYLTENLQRLRAACCHPQLGTHGVTGGKLQRVRQMEGNSVAVRVLSMEQILDKFIDDARQKCEEAQRLAIMHTNAMAAITRLKIEARSRGVSVTEDDLSLLMGCADLYKESLALAEKNSTPQSACGEAVVTGNVGFFSPNQIICDGSCELSWKIQPDIDNVWAKFEYQGPGKKLNKLRFRAKSVLLGTLAEENSLEFAWRMARPTSIALQVAVAADGGEFVDVMEAPVHSDGTWSDVSKFRSTKRSRTWRVVIKLKDQEGNNLPSGSKIGYLVSLDIQLFEAHIESDSLQLLHSLHNASLAYESALQLKEERDTRLEEEVASLRKEANLIESLYKAQPQIFHKACMEKFKDMTTRRKEKQRKLFEISALAQPNKKIIDGWDDGWYDDFLSVVCLYGSEVQKNSIFERIIQDIEGIYVEDSSMRLPNFSDLAGLRAALGVRLRKIRSEGLGKNQKTLPATTADNEFVQIRSTRYKCSTGEHSDCMKSIVALSPNPNEAELAENSHCRLCKADWNQTGPICSVCRIAQVLKDLRPDSVTVAVLTALYGAVRTPIAASLLQERELFHVVDRAKLFFELLEAEEREKVEAWKMWRAHLQLMNDYDELASTKHSMRLSQESEDLTLYTEDQLNAIVQPFDLITKYHNHAAKRAMALGDLRRATGTLRYLQNQRNESGDDSLPDNCIVCLRSLMGECCVLKCGHRFHEKPCFDQILRTNNGSRVYCPMKCREITSKSEVMVATDKCRNDGSRASRLVKGSFGTKVTRIVSDILTMRHKGEKGVVFSQWHTMLEIVEVALRENGVVTARPKGGKKFKEGIRQFQSPDCAVLLLQLKQGAEGLTLVQATNVFMIEPVMSRGLDQQAINRIHRIGQTRKCHVWRYLIEDTIEMKLDKIRTKHQQEADVVEDNVTSYRKTDLCSAGGCDGGFASKDELMEMLG